MSFTNLWVGYNQKEDFRILICALDKVEAQELANSYCLDSNMEGEFETSFAENIENLHFDCDYVIS